MSTLQHAKPRFANQSITDESGRPGTVRSNVGCDAIDEPCTNSTAGLPPGVSTNFSHRNRRTPFLSAQCSTPCTVQRAAAASTVSFNALLPAASRLDRARSIDARAGVADHLRPQVLFGTEERAELRGRGPDDFDARRRHVSLDLVLAEHGDELAIEPIDDRRRRTLRREK